MAEEPESHTLHLLREMRKEIAGRFDSVDEQLKDIAAVIGELKIDIKELSLATGLLEVRMSKALDRLDRIEKHLGLVKV